ncbi:MAG: hypothetical protein ACLRNW_07585 [Neglectibacter sp.]
MRPLDADRPGGAHRDRTAHCGRAVSVGRTGNITASLPKGQDMDSRHRVTVTVTDQETTPQKNVTVIVKSDLGGTAQGQTNKDGELTVPAADSAYTDDTGTAVVGQYTVIVTDTAEKPVKGALVTRWLVRTAKGTPLPSCCRTAVCWTATTRRW